MGKYKVSFGPPETIGMTREEVAALPKIQGKYLSPDTSGIEAEIKSGKNYFEFTLEAAK